MKWCFWTVVLEKTLESLIKEIKPVNPKGIQPWIFIGRTDAEAVTLATWWEEPTQKDLDAGKDWRQEEKGTTEDEVARWHHWFNGHKFEQALEDGEGQCVCCSPWGSKSQTQLSDWTTAKTILGSYKIINI